MEQNPVHKVLSPEERIVHKAGLSSLETENSERKPRQGWGIPNDRPAPKISKDCDKLGVYMLFKRKTPESFEAD